MHSCIHAFVVGFLEEILYVISPNVCTASFTSEITSEILLQSMKLTFHSCFFKPCHKKKPKKLDITENVNIKIFRVLGYEPTSSSILYHGYILKFNTNNSIYVLFADFCQFCFAMPSSTLINPLWLFLS